MVWMFEKKKVKKRKISYKKPLKDGNALEGIPEDLMFCEILPRLPIKLLFRFKSVCKLWNNIITPNNKLLAHRHHSLNSMNLCFYFERQEYVVSYSDDHAHQFKLLKPYFVNYYCTVIGSINGLLYGFCSRFRDRDIFICNPVTKHDVVYVPNPNNLYHIALVVDHNNHYNAGFVIIGIVKIHNAVKFEVYSSKAKEWRVSNAEIQAPSLNPNNLQIPFQERVRKYNPVFKGGMVYWSFMSYIVWFDVKEDVAGLIPCPSQDNIVYHYPLTRGTYSDIGACSDSDSELSYIKGTQEGDIEIWLLKRKRRDCKEFEWVKRFDNVSLEEIFRRNWNIMSKFCSLIKVKSLTEVVEKILADSHIIYPLPYLGGVVVWFWMYLECKEDHYGKLFSFDLRNQHLKVLDGDFFLPSHPFSPSFLSCPT